MWFVGLGVKIVLKPVVFLKNSWFYIEIREGKSGKAVGGMNLLGQNDLELMIENSVGVIFGTELDFCVDNFLNIME